MKGDQRSRRPALPGLERLQRLGVWLPVIGMGLLFGLVEAITFYIHHLTPLPHWLFHVAVYLFVMGIITAGAYFFSRFMFRTVQQKEREIFRRNQELSTLNAVGAVVSESLELNEILHRSLDKVLEVTGAEAGEVFLWDEGTEELVLQAFRGRFPEAFQEITRFKLNDGFPGRIAHTGKALVVHDLQGEPLFLRRRVKEAGFQSFAGVPLKSKGTVVGVMTIAALNPRRLTSEDVNLLAALGNQIGVAIENARLYAQLKEMTVLEERQRIAREMHDGLAQQLGYLHLKLGEMEMHPLTLPVQEEIRLVKKLTAEAYEEVRQAIFGLKMVPRRVGLVPALREYLREFSEQTGLRVTMKIADEGATRLSPQVEVQLIRIVQEALANIRRHAQAGYAWVIFDAEEGRARVTIQDDGQGFDPAEATGLGGTSFGLQVMRERAESVGGVFTVESQPGNGTQVIVWLPLGEEEAALWRP